MNSTTRKSFIRIGEKKHVLELVKEAKRVKYNVEVNKMGRDVFSYVITDPENNNALVFKSVQVRPGMWATSYSTEYWQDDTEEKLAALRA